MSNYRIETKCVQSGYEPGNGEPRVLPIYQSTTFRYTSSEQMGRLFDLEESGYFYTRLQNPTNDAVAAKICDLEGGAAAMLTSSGQAANFYAIMNIAEEGDLLQNFLGNGFVAPAEDHVGLNAQAQQLLGRVLSRFGLQFSAARD